MSVPPTASGGATEAMFVVVRAEFGEFMRHTGFHLFIARGQTATAPGRRPTTPGPSWRPTTRPTFNAFSVSDTEGPAFQTLTKLIFFGVGGSTGETADAHRRHPSPPPPAKDGLACTPVVGADGVRSECGECALRYRYKSKRSGHDHVCGPDTFWAPS